MIIISKIYLDEGPKEGGTRSNRNGRVSIVIFCLTPAYRELLYLHAPKIDEKLKFENVTKETPTPPKRHHDVFFGNIDVCGP